MSSNLTVSILSIVLLFCVLSKASDKLSGKLNYSNGQNVHVHIYLFVRLFILAQCPRNKEQFIAIASLCNEETKCLDSDTYNYVCMKDFISNQSITNYCASYTGKDGIECMDNSSSSANPVLQCYTTWNQ